MVAYIHDNGTLRHFDEGSLQHDLVDEDPAWHKATKAQIQADIDARVGNVGEPQAEDDGEGDEEPPKPKRKR